MNRFRRKSDARKAAKANLANSPSPSPSLPDLRSSLPVANDFRTSLILPHLTRRFTLLRSEDGRLVSLDTMQQNLEAQQKTGALSAVEVEAVLAQYRLQSMYEGPREPQTAPAWASSWSPTDTSRSARAASFATLDSSDPDHDHTSGSYTSSVPFPYSPTSNGETSDSGLPHSAALPYKRGGNSMFGGRVSSVAQLRSRMPKSSSTTSLKSVSSKTPSRASPPTLLVDDQPIDAPDTDDSRSMTTGEDGMSSAHFSDAEEGDVESQSGHGHERGSLEDDSDVVPLTQKQLNRISRALDIVEANLAPIYHRPKSIAEEPEGEAVEELTTSTASEVEEPLSPMSDTEAIDPFFHRLATTSSHPPQFHHHHSSSQSSSSPSAAHSFPPSISSAHSTPLPSPFLSRANATPTPSLHSPPRDRRPSEASQRGLAATPLPSTRASSAQSYHSLAQSQAHSPDPDPNLSPSFSFSTSTSSSSIAAPSDPQTPLRSRETSIGSSVNDSMSPTAFTFPDVPRREHDEDLHDTSFSDDGGPFDLGYSSSRASGLTRAGSKGVQDTRRAYAGTSASTSSGLFSPGMNGSSSSLESVGSSYHAGKVEELEEDEEEVELAGSSDERETLQRRESKGKGKARERRSSDSSDDDHLRVASRAMSRRPSDELLRDISPSSDGEVDLALEDLVLIQETLVRSASRKAARMLEAAAASSSSRSVSEAGSPRRPSAHFEEPPQEEDEEDEYVEEETVEEVEEEQEQELPENVGIASLEVPVSRDWQRGSMSSEPSAALSSSMTSQTSEDSAKARLSSVNTPSSMQSDAFEFSSNLAASVRRPSDDEAEETLTASQPPPLPTLLAPVELVDQISSLRVPRTMAPRNPNATQSVLIRDVRNQANIATMQLKKGPLISPSAKGSVTRYKSVKHAPISHPQLIEAPEGLAVVPISHPVSEDHSHDHDGRSKGKSGIGLRFKMLLKKQSRDHLRNLNGDEVTPFVEFETAPGSPPQTPPDQSTAQFASTPSDYPHTPLDYPETPEDPRPFAQVGSPALPSVPETPEQHSPAVSTSSTSGSAPRSLGRFVSRFRRNRAESDVSVTYEEHRSVDTHLSIVDAFASPSRKPTIQGRPSEAGLGLGLATDSGRAPISYDIGSWRGRSSPRLGLDSDVPQTAPLAPQKRYPDPLDLSTSTLGASTSTTSAPLLGSMHSPRASHESTRSTSSMKKLWEAAEDLGLPPDKVQELVDLSYAQSPTSSSADHHLSSSTASGSTSNYRRRPSVPSIHPSEREEDHTNENLRRSHSSRRSVKDRAPTPPPGPGHFRKASQDLFAEAGPVPAIPPTARRVSLLSADDNSSCANKRISRLSIPGSASGSLRPPKSPGSQSSASFRSSGYANSIYDLYGEDSAGEGETERYGGGEEGHGEQYLQGEVQEEPVPDCEDNRRDSREGEVIWQVVGDLKSHRDSAYSFQSHSRKSSTDSQIAALPPPPDPIQLLLRRHRRKTSAQAIMNVPAQPNRGRFTASVFLRDEERLAVLAKEGGVAAEEAGFFLVRPPEFDLPPPQPEYDAENERGVRVTMRRDY